MLTTYTKSQVLGYINAVTGLERIRRTALEELSRLPPLPQIRGPIDEEDDIIDFEWCRIRDKRREVLGKYMRNYAAYRDMIPLELRDEEPVASLLRDLLRIFN